MFLIIRGVSIMPYPTMTASGYYENVIGKTEEMKYVIEMANYMTDVNALVLLTGEIGTGKKFYSRYMHNISLRSNGPFLIAHCRPGRWNITTGELFGTEVGGKIRPGIFEQASGGTVLIENIELLDIEDQGKVLKLLQTKRMYRMGGADRISLDVRIMASTTEDLGDLTKNGMFREDLFYMLQDGIIELPPLRDRGFDIVRYARNFVQEYNMRYLTELAFRSDHISEKALIILGEYSWPGNLREMRNTMERAVILRHQTPSDKHGTPITANSLKFLTDVPVEVDYEEDYEPEPVYVAPGQFVLEIPDEGIGFDTIAKDLILRTLELTNGNKSKAAKYLNLTLDVFKTKLKRSGIKIKKKKVIQE